MEELRRLGGFNKIRILVGRYGSVFSHLTYSFHANDARACSSLIHRRLHLCLKMLLLADPTKPTGRNCNRRTIKLPIGTNTQHITRAFPIDSNIRPSWISLVRCMYGVGDFSRSIKYQGCGGWTCLTRMPICSLSWRSLMVLMLMKVRRT